MPEIFSQSQTNQIYVNGNNKKENGLKNRTRRALKWG
jgi:hypothetical protein